MADLNIGNSSASVVINAKHNGSVIPQINNTYDLGTSDLRWKNIYGGTFVGSFNGNATTANGLKSQGRLDSQEKIDNFLAANSLRYAIFKTTEQNNIGMGSNDGMIISIPWDSTSYGAQIAFDDDQSGLVKFRAKTNGTWGSWATLLHSSNYTSYTVTKTGSGASGTWGISINGNAATATSLSAEITNDKLPARLRVNTSPTNANADTFKQSGFYYSTTGLPSGIDDANIFSINHTNGGWGHQLAFKFGGAGISGTSYDGADIYSRCYSSNTNSWSSWHVLLSSGNYTKYTVTKTGGGASGTWGISISGNAATASKVNNKLTVGSKSYDGSAAVTIEASDLGLASAMLFLGTTTTAITDGATTNPVVIGGSNKTVKAGNVVLYGSKEFVWTGSAWEELGNEGSYKIVQAAVADPSASGTSNTFIATISQDANGKITATKKTVAVTNSAPTLAWGATSTIGTVAGTNLQVKMPANPNTDTKVTQTVTTSNAAYPLLLAPNGQTATTTTTSYFDSGVTLNPSTNTIAANISGNATTATKLATARNITIGNRTNSFNGSSDIAYNLQDVLISHGNEFNYTFGGIADLWFNYRTETGTNSTTKITDYHFANGQGGTDGVTIHASNFSGNAATATNIAWSGITNKPSYYDIPKYTIHNVGYVSSDTHILELGYWNCTYSYDNLTLLISSSFWGNQHGSTDIITLRQDLNDNASGKVQCSCNRVKLMNSNRTFYYNIDQTNRRVYLYVYVTGGNSYGKWNISVLQSDGGFWTSEFAWNQPKQSSFVTISEITAAINADAFVKRDGDTMTGNLTAPSVYASNWFRSTGTSGWYNESYGGGIYMQDSTWVRTYGGKLFHVANTDQDAIYTTGGVRADNEFRSYTPNALRLCYGSKPVILRNDGTDFYILISNNSNAGDNWITPSGGAHPLRINLTSGYCYSSRMYGAVWNDYAEYRSSNITEPGRVVIENGDGTLSLATERLQRGAEIISDTFGFAIGETDECKTPIAVSGRVLAYYSGDIKEFKPGYPVCSGPNGTVSVMTEEEEEKYPSRIIGTVSEIPTYEKWGTGNVEVNGRIWIRIR